MKTLDNQQPCRIAIAQIDFALGDIPVNTQNVIQVALQAKQQGASLVVFPELTLTGYPPEDLLYRPGLYRRIETALQQLCDELKDKDIAIVIGYPHKTAQGIYNAACVIDQGKIIANYHKQHLPNYSVFDEKRYFIAGDQPCVFNHQGIPIGLTICEDLWAQGPLTATINAGAELLIVINASPFHLSKADQREQMLRARQQQEGAIPIIYAHWAASQDELVFDGGSLVMDAQGNTCQRAKFFSEQMLKVDIYNNDQTISVACEQLPPLPSEEALAYQALVAGTRGYVHKNHFKGALIGLSGGIDSALTLTIAVDALGKENVEAVMMPSRYTTQISLEDAQALAENLGVRYRTISIEPAFQAFLDSLDDAFAGLPVDVTEQNIQARCRAIILMALSNKFGKIVLTTGNKSEIAVGYATLYGDMAGGYAVLKDVYKTMVYRLAKYRNSLAAVIPQRTITRAPSAELADNQKDEDSLPAYAILDEILRLNIEADQDMEEIIAAGFSEHDVRRTLALVYRNEYKRQQAAPGVRITERAFGKDRRYPLTTQYSRAFKESLFAAKYHQK